jgi:hypothetical protein
MAPYAHADGAQPSTAAATPARIRISISNVYDAELDFGPLGSGRRKGTDRAEGELKRGEAGYYAGTVQAVVTSEQQIKGLMGSCGPKHYEDSQKLRVKGHPVDGFNADVQTVDLTAVQGQTSGKYLKLEFVPETPPTQVPNRPGEDKIVNCHTLIETPYGIFLPLNDSRWTMEDGGYVIALPSSASIDYTDETAEGAQVGPFKANKSVWTIRVEALP